jgi:two-component system response regulator YesN
MKIVLVDDEQIVLTGIGAILENHKERFSVEAACGSGAEALEAIRRCRADVVITDIRMNGMSGLELAEKIKDIDDGVLVILLSGYSDFMFAQKALTLGVFDYLVKPTRYSDIVNCLTRAEKHILKRRNSAGAGAEIGAGMGAGAGSGSGAGSGAGSDGSGGNAGSDGSEIGAGADALVAGGDVDARGAGGSAGRPGGDGEALAAIFLRDAMRGLIADPDEIDEKNARLGLHIARFIVVSVEVESWSPSPGSAAKGAKGAKGIRDTFSMNYALRNMFEDVFSPFDRLVPIVESINNFVMLVCVSDSAETDRARASRCAGACVRMAMDMLNVRLVIGMSDIKPSLAMLRQAYGESGLALKSASKKGLGFVCFGAENFINGSYSPAVQKALEYIHSHYCEDISLKMVAQEVFLNTWYFSEIFKKEVGKAFTDYILNLRIARAKQLIEDKRLPLYQIAYMVGINGPGYFSQVFKRITGLSPKEYRKKAL